jgi:hypothetical protein
MIEQRIELVLLFLILVVLLYGRKAFWNAVADVVVLVAGLLHFAVFFVCFGILILLVEMVVSIGTSGLPFEKWLVKHSVLTLWLPGLAILIGYILYASRKRRKNWPTKSND